MMDTRTLHQLLDVSASRFRLNIYYHFFGVCGVCYVFAVDYRKQKIL